MGKLTTLEVKFWLAEADSCEKRQQRELIQRNNYPFLINYYEGIEKIDPAHPHVAAYQQAAIINEFFPNTNRLISEIMYQNPDILLEATKPQAEDGLPLMKSALAYLFNKAEGLIENRIALFDMLYAGYCGIEIDHFVPAKAKSLPQDTEQPEQEGIIGKVVSTVKKIINPNEVEQTIESQLPQIETAYATNENTYLRRYNPLDILFDWRAERLKDRRYSLKKVWLSKAEFDAKYPKFKNRVNPIDRKFEYSSHAFDEQNIKVLLYEFQVRKRDNVYQTIIVCPSIGTEEIDTFERPYVTNGFNMKIGTLHKYGKLYPIAYAQINKKMQDEMNHYVRFMMDVAERNIPKRIADRNKIKPDGIAALNSDKVNDLVLVDGNPGTVIAPAPQTNVSVENQSLLMIFQDQKNKLWAISEPRIGGKSNMKFATEMVIQEQGFEATQLDIQEGLRFLIQEELNTGKDIIVSFWDNAVFLKVTGHPKMDWYEPILAPDPNNPDRQIVVNPLTDLLTGDYEVKIDISSAGRPNREQQLQRMTLFMTHLVALRPILQSQGKDINIEEIVKISKEFGWNPDKLLIDFVPAQQPSIPAASGEVISPEEDAMRQAEAERRVAEGEGAPIG